MSRPYRYAGDRPYNQADAVDWRVYAFLGALTALVAAMFILIIASAAHASSCVCHQDGRYTIRCCAGRACEAFLTNQQSAGYCGG